METRIADLNDILWCLESARNWCISQYQVSSHELIVVLIHKHLGLEDVVQARLVNQTEVWFNDAFVCKTMKTNGLEVEQHKSR